jgi:multidrug efflux pump
MILSDLSIRRPVFASMVSVAIVLFGIIGYRELAVREYPDVDPPLISVSTSLPGANPQVVESAVTDVLEEELSTVPGIRTLTSSSAEQNSNISIEFQLERDVEAAAQDVRDKVARVRNRLPQDVLEPVIAKQEADARPFMWLALSGDNVDLLRLSDVADRLVKSRLQTISGVGNIIIGGERRYAMRVWLSTAALAARQLTVQDVEAAIRSRNVEIPAGRIESSRREFSVRSLGELKTPAEFSELVVANQGGQLVKLRDIGRVELGPQDDRSALRFMGRPAVGVGIVRQSKSNMVDVADRVRAEVPSIQQSLPPGVKLQVAFDQAVFVKRSILEAQETLVLAAGLVVAIIFFFLRNVRSTIIPGLAIPVSIIGTFAIMYFLDFSINNLTLLALTLAIGIVVDDAIIVLENAYRHQEELDEEPETAALEGSREIGFAVVATTIALVAVFAPLAFLKGNTGRLFNEFGIAVAGSVILSGLVALTLTPMLCAKVLRVPKEHGPLFRMFERGFDAVTDGYAWLLRRALDARWVVLGGAVALVALSVLVFRSLKREFIPAEDRGEFSVAIIGPEGSTLLATDEAMRATEAILGKTPDIANYFSVTGGFGGTPARGFVFVRLTPWDERTRSVTDVLNEVRPKFMQIPGAFVFANNPPAFGGFGAPVQFVVRHPNFELLTAGMDSMLARARSIKGLLNVDTDLRVNKPEVLVAFDRDRAEDLGVPVRDVAATMQTLLGGRRNGTFTRENKLYDVLVQLDPAERATPSDVSGLYVRGRDNQLVQLSAVTKVTESVGPRSLAHYDRVRSATLTAQLAPGFTLGEAIDSLRAISAEVLPAGASYRLGGESRELEESGSSLYFAFALAIAVVFMVLASQFESLIHPLTVLLAVPLAVTGALVTLWLAGSTINLYSQIGMILLIGLVTKNSILLVEYANQLKERGLAPAAAILESGRIRLRPILMTSVSTITGALPIALGLGAGSISRRPLGYAIVGGVLVSTLLTLFLVPAFWLLVEGVRGRVRHPAAAPVPATAVAGERE